MVHITLIIHPNNIRYNPENEKTKIMESLELEDAISGMDQLLNGGINQDKVNWQQKFDCFVFQYSMVKHILNIQQETILEIEEILETQSENYHCNKEITKKVSEAMFQLKEDHNSFYTYHQINSPFLDSFEYNERRRIFDIINLDLKKIKVEFLNIQHKYSLLEKKTHHNRHTETPLTDCPGISSNESNKTGNNEENP